MKICAIRGEGLASLAQPFALELDQPPLNQSGLFAITGPTGSGKSTLLDTLCLALFDRVPRLDAISGQAMEGMKAQDPRQLLRKGAAEGWAEVEFLDGAGNRFCSRWSVRRARLAVEGRLQHQEMTLIETKSNLRIGRTKKEVLHEIETRLGLSYSQFRRSVLLAQGDFAAFLSASERERSELLERITGTEIYSRVSMLAHEQASLFQLELKQLQQRRTELGPVDEQELPLEKAELAVQEQKKKLANLIRQQEQTSEQSRWSTSVERIQRRLATIEKGEKANSAVIETLSVLSTTRSLHPLYLGIQEKSQSTKVMEKELADLTAKLSQVNDDLMELDSDIGKGEAAVQRLSALREVAVELKRLNEEHSFHLQKEKQSAAQLRRLNSKTANLTKQYREHASILQDQEQELALKSQAERLAKLRSELKEGQHCPLCGSQEHPWTSQSATHSDELAKSIATTKQRLHSLTKEQANAEAESLHCQKEQRNHKESAKSIDLQLAKIREQWSNGVADEEWHEQLALAISLPKNASSEESQTSNTEGITIVKRLDTNKKKRVQRDRDRSSLLGQKSKVKRDLEVIHKVIDRDRETLSLALLDLALSEDTVLKAWSHTPEWEQEQRKNIESSQAEKERTIGQLEECQARLAELKKEKLPQASLDELNKEIKQGNSDLKNLESMVQGLHTQRTLQKQKNLERSSLESRLQALLKESAISETLRELIGSRDGHKFRKFAQGLTLEYLLSATNQHLREIAPRYRLEKHPDADLGLLVIDQEMGDETRTTDTLSGGESFLVSLGLALGLSSLSSDHSKIENLFIDEGFGTLDQRNLDLALDMLDQLQAMGRQIGVISHLPNLIERLDTTVKVTPSLTNGSTLRVHHANA